MLEFGSNLGVVQNIRTLERARMQWNRIDGGVVPLLRLTALNSALLAVRLLAGSMRKPQAILVVIVAYCVRKRTNCLVSLGVNAQSVTCSHRKREARVE